MTIYLNAEVVSGLGEDTFWTWFHREFPGSVFGVPEALGPGDVVLQYSTLGAPRFPERTVALLWELHPEMKARLGSSEWDGVIARIGAAGAARWRTTASKLMVPYYQHLGPIDVLPIGVDTDLFAPRGKGEARRRLGVPDDVAVGLWSGTTHRMKGYDRLLEYAAQHPAVRWIIAWKDSGSPKMPGALNVERVPQDEFAWLMSAADFSLSASRLRPLYMVEWEAMACDLPVISLDDDDKDLPPSVLNPRDAMIRAGWSRHDAKLAWGRYLDACANST